MRRHRTRDTVFIDAIDTADLAFDLLDLLATVTVELNH